MKINRPTHGHCTRTRLGSSQHLKQRCGRGVEQDTCLPQRLELLHVAGYVIVIYWLRHCNLLILYLSCHLDSFSLLSPKGVHSHIFSVAFFNRCVILGVKIIPRHKVNGRLRCLGSSQHLKQRFGRGFEADIKIQPPSDAEAAEVMRILQEQGAVPLMGDRLDR